MIKTLLLFFLTLTLVISTRPSGQYCASQSVLTHTFLVTTSFTDNSVDFRVDRDMHWTWCNDNHYTLNADHTLSVGQPIKECFQNLVDQKLNGNVPRFSYDVAKDEVVVDVDIIAALGLATKVVLSKGGCEESNPALKEDL